MSLGFPVFVQVANRLAFLSEFLIFSGSLNTAYILLERSSDSRKFGNRCNSKRRTILRGYGDWNKQHCLLWRLSATAALSGSLRVSDVFISKTYRLISLSFTCYLSLTHHFKVCKMNDSWADFSAYVRDCFCVCAFPCVVKRDHIITQHFTS